jgi:hypothetical protein
VCRITIEKILDISIKEIKILTVEGTIRPRRDSKGVRLDIQAIDENGDVYNIEMQVGGKMDIRSLELPRRVRYTSERKYVRLIA